MIAGYHHKLPTDLSADMARTRDEVVRWSMNDYALALAKGDAMSSDEHRKILDQLARYTGLRPEVIEARTTCASTCRPLCASCCLTRNLSPAAWMAASPSPNPGNERFYDPTGAAILPPYTSASITICARS